MDVRFAPDLRHLNPLDRIIAEEHPGQPTELDMVIFAFEFPICPDQNNARRHVRRKLDDRAIA